MRSMTAFAIGETRVPGTSDSVLVCELRTVNHRYADLSIKLAENLRFAENALRNLLGQVIKRGKLDANLYLKKAEGLALTLDRAALDTLRDLTRTIEAQWPQTRPVSAVELLTFPGVLQKPSIDPDALQQTLLDLVARVAAELGAIREREGAVLAQFMLERCHQVENLIGAAQNRLPEVLQAQRQKLQERVVDLLAQPDLNRLEQELLYLAQKMDVAEELSRLQAHVQEARSLMTAMEPVGRRLDFLVQEMHREANTLGAKSADLTMTRIAMDLKLAIDQMREQVQNIE